MAQLSDLTPQPGLSPAQVVQYQVTALQHNDDPKSDAGIERAFQFASPANKQATGPLENFTQILKSPAYAPMLNNRSSEVVGSEVKENQGKGGREDYRRRRSADNLYFYPLQPEGRRIQ